MRRKFLFLFAGILFVLTASAQDVIKMKDGKEIQAKISEITQDEIKYKNFDYQDGPTFTINKSDVSTITYANGMTEEVKATSKPAQATSSEESGSFWNPTLYTNQHVAALSPYVDLGGFIMSGGKIGIEARWRRLAASVAFKTGPSKFYWTLGGEYDDGSYDLESLSGSGVATGFKVLLPSPNKNTVAHVGIVNEITNIKYVFSKYSSGRVSDSWNTDYYSTGFGGGFTHYKDNGLFFRASAYFGISAGVGNYFYEHNWSDGGHTAYWTNKTSWIDFFGTIEATIGYQIPLKIK
jgi:hypothetical protein